MHTITNIFHSGYQQVGSISQEISSSVVDALKVITRVTWTAIKIITKFSAAFALYYLSPHLFFWTATVSCLFLSEHADQMTNKVQDVLLNVLWNGELPIYARIPILAGMTIVFVHDFPDWVNLAAIYSAARFGIWINQTFSSV